MNITTTGYAFELESAPSGQLVCIVDDDDTTTVKTLDPNPLTPVLWTKVGTIPANADGTGVRGVHTSYGPWPSRDNDGIVRILFSPGRGQGRTAQLIEVLPE